MKQLHFFWTTITIVLCTLLVDLKCFTDARAVDEQTNLVKKRTAKSSSLQSLSEHNHAGFEMFSMMDYPHKKLQMYAADPVQRLLYSTKDLGHINGILTDKDVIEVEDMDWHEQQQQQLQKQKQQQQQQQKVQQQQQLEQQQQQLEQQQQQLEQQQQQLEQQQQIEQQQQQLEQQQQQLEKPETDDNKRPGNEQQFNNHVSNEHRYQNPVTVEPLEQRNVPTRNVGFSPNSIRASDIEFFNNAAKMTKSRPTKKVTSLRNTWPTVNRRKYPPTKERLRSLMKHISTLLKENVAGSEPTKPVTKNCEDNKVSTQKENSIRKERISKVIESNQGNFITENGNENQFHGVRVLPQRVRSGGGNSKRSGAVETDKSDAKRMQLGNSLHDSAVTSHPITKASTSHNIEKGERKENEVEMEPLTEELKLIVSSTAVPSSHEQTTVEVTRAPTTTRLVTTTGLLKTTKEKIRKVESKSKTAITAMVNTKSGKIVSRATLDRNMDNRVKPVIPARIFKIREWHLPVFTMRKPCPLRADALIRTNNNKVMAIDGSMMYIIGRTGVEAGPMPLKEYWPEVITPINDAYIRMQDHGSVVFFQGRYASYYNDKLLGEGPTDIAALGLPRHMTSFDAVSTWTGNRKTYFFKGSNYWRYNEAYRRFDHGYPRSIKRNWRGLPDHVDTAFIAPNHHMYFVKNGLIYKMGYHTAKVKYRYPKRLFDSCYEFFM